MIVDFHVHIDENKNADCNGIPTKMGRKEILLGMKKAGIDFSILLNMAPKNDIKKTREQNQWLANICKENKTLFGFGSVQPDDGDKALDEMNRCVQELNLKGFKLHPNTQQFNTEHSFLPNILKKAAELDVPVLIDSYSPLDDNQPSKFLSLIGKSPDTKICLAHVGFYRFLDFGIYGFLKNHSAANLKNIYFDLSATCAEFYKSPLQNQFRWITEKIGPDNLLFGSDFPLYSPKQALEAVKKFGYKKSWLPRILGINAKRLLKL